MNGYRKALNQYADFKGRASRTEFWMFALIHTLIILAVSALGFGISVLTGNIGANLLSGLYLMAVLIPVCAISFRRLHDTGKSGWYLLLGLIPLLGLVWLLFLLIVKGITFDNQYGKEPDTVHYIRYNRRRSAAVALILASFCFASVLYFQHLEIEYLLFNLLLPACVLLTGVLLFLSRKFSISVARSLIFISILWLIRDVYIILNEYPLLLSSFNLLEIIKLMRIIIPIGLCLSGILMAKRKSDYTVPASLLFVGSSIWIVYLVLYVSQIPVVNIYSFEPVVMVVVPVSLMVFARTLLSKEITTKKTEITETNLPVEPKPIRKPLVIPENKINVNFVREDRDGSNIWSVHQAPSKKEATEFLSKQTVSKPNYYVIVETPEGNFGRDKDGLYQE